MGRENVLLEAVSQVSRHLAAVLALNRGYCMNLAVPPRKHKSEKLSVFTLCFSVDVFTCKDSRRKANLYQSLLLKQT